MRPVQLLSDIGMVVFMQLSKVELGIMLPCVSMLSKFKADGETDTYARVLSPH